MSVLSKLILPIKNEKTGVVTNTEFDIRGYTKELTKSVAAGATSCSFTDSAITANATYDVYSTAHIQITGQSISDTTFTVTFKAAPAAMTMKLRIS